MQMKYRLLNRIYAFINGYFWKDCPLCGEYFGGHEWKDYCGLASSVVTKNEPRVEIRKSICPDCTKTGKGTPRNYGRLMK